MSAPKRKRKPKTRVRDYAAEYRKRIKKGIERGYSRDQSRGHPKDTEMSIKTVQRVLRQIETRDKNLRARARGTLKRYLGAPTIDRYTTANEKRPGVDPILDLWAEIMSAYGASSREVYTLHFSP